MMTNSTELQSISKLVDSSQVPEGHIEFWTGTRMLNKPR